jgi:hypothetical protein
VLAFAVCAIAQEKEKTTIKTTTTTVKSGFDLLGGETFNVTDATPFETHAVDLRFAFRWETENFPANAGDSNDDFYIQPVVVWGSCPNVEVSVSTPVQIGDGGNIPGQADGHHDSYFGLLWKLTDQQDYWPALALASNLRVPTGQRSNGVDWELRLAMTNQYDSGIRSHFNIFGITANHDNYDDLRHFQYGAVAGLDGPLCADGAVRWVFDYMYRIGQHEGGGGKNIAEAGWQWQIDDCNKLGMSVQAGLDHAEDEAANLGAALTYAYTLKY